MKDQEHPVDRGEQALQLMKDFEERIWKDYGSGRATHAYYKLCAQLFTALVGRKPTPEERERFKQ